METKRIEKPDLLKALDETMTALGTFVTIADFFLAQISDSTVYYGNPGHASLSRAMGDANLLLGDIRRARLQLE